MIKNAHSILHAYKGSAKILAFMKDVDRMQNALSEITGPNVNACLATEAIHMTNVGNMNALQIQSAQQPKHAEMRNVSTLVIVQKMHNVHQEITGAFVHVCLDTQGTHMESDVHQVSILF